MLFLNNYCILTENTLIDKEKAKFGGEIEGESNIYCRCSFKRYR